MNTKRAKRKLSRIKLRSRETKSEASKLWRLKNKTKKWNSYKKNCLPQNLHFQKNQHLSLQKILINTRQKNLPKLLVLRAKRQAKREKKSQHGKKQRNNKRKRKRLKLMNC